MDPELFDENSNFVNEKLGIEQLSMPSSHGPVGAPPVSGDEVAIADATILQKVKDREINK